MIPKCSSKYVCATTLPATPLKENGLQLFLTEGGEELPLLRIISEKDNAPVCDEREDWI